MKNAHLRFGWLTYVKSTEKTTTSIKLRLDRFIGEVLPDPPRQAKAHLISVIGGDTQIAGRKRGDLAGRQVYGGRARCTADSSMPRTKRTVFQRLHTVDRAQETAPAPDWFVGRVGRQQCIGDFKTNPAGSFRQPIHLGCTCAYSWNPRNAGVGRLVCGRTGCAQSDHSCSRHWMRPCANQKR